MVVLSCYGFTNTRSGGTKQAELVEEPVFKMVKREAKPRDVQRARLSEKLGFRGGGEDDDNGRIMVWLWRLAVTRAVDIVSHVCSFSEAQQELIIRFMVYFS